MRLTWAKNECQPPRGDSIDLPTDRHNTKLWNDRKVHQVFLDGPLHCGTLNCRRSWIIYRHLRKSRKNFQQITSKSKLWTEPQKNEIVFVLFCIILIQLLHIIWQLLSWINLPQKDKYFFLFHLNYVSTYLVNN